MGYPLKNVWVQSGFNKELGSFWELDILKIHDDCGDQDTAAIVRGKVDKGF